LYQRPASIVCSENTFNQKNPQMAQVRQLSQALSPKPSAPPKRVASAKFLDLEGFIVAKYSLQVPNDKKKRGIPP